MQGVFMDIDSLDHHIKHVTREHDKLADQLEHMLRQKSWNEYDAENIKKEKLKLKDELSRLYRQRYDLAQEVDLHDDR
jgi:uncharacterized protein YdcH (DUF465 family)